MDGKAPAAADIGHSAAGARRCCDHPSLSAMPAEYAARRYAFGSRDQEGGGGYSEKHRSFRSCIQHRRSARSQAAVAEYLSVITEIVDATIRCRDRFAEQYPEWNRTQDSSTLGMVHV